ncbi:SpoIIE family protein phosphatase [Streptomyces sp. NA04227]|uniref:SpoIIE family protein phosphatase n=1 Tax=Streptomyces sp. NA04227 TaxID=2742136 RepID=UPI0034CE7FFF
MGLRSVATQVFILLVAVVSLLFAGAVGTFVWNAVQHSQEHAREQALAASETFANSPATVSALGGDDPSASLQPRAEEARSLADAESVAVVSTQGILYTHRDPAQIGRSYPGSIERALRGESYTVSSDGPFSSEAVQGLAPVTDRDGSVIGVVAVGIAPESVAHLPVLFASAGGALLLATGGVALVSRRLGHQTRGLGPQEITRMYEHHDAVLHSVREGVLIIDGEHRLLLANDEAQRLLGLPDGTQGRPVTDLGLDEPLADLLASGRSATDEIHLAGERVLAVNLRPTQGRVRRYGSVATLRDTTELRALTGKADVARTRLRLLNEASARIGSSLDVTRTAEELTEATVPGFADTAIVDLVESVLAGEEPSDSSTHLRRVAAADTGAGAGADSLPRSVGELIRHGPSTPQAQAFDSGKAVLVPGVQDPTATPARPPGADGPEPEGGDASLITVPLRARGVTLGVASFSRAPQSEPFETDDLAVAEELAARAAVSIDNARRYTREHTTAVTLQRSLLPRGTPEQVAVEVAHRYLPARAGVGGDWFDVIPLSSARVALVVGDVVGHGLHAAATMGRLRTAVHNFSALDLPPDELLTHLDDLVSRIDHDTASADDSDGIVGATCLYAVYDPVSRSCALARAGHPPPALIHPDGSVEFLEVPAGPPLGVGGLPFETLVLDITEGSQLALYTDGLIESRSRDIDTGFEILRRALSHPGRSPQQTCDAALSALLPAGNDDDIALLVARARAMAAEQIASWDVPAVPNAVADVRKAAVRQLNDWGLQEAAFTTELVLSELVTNAIRHGTGPIQVRLLRDTSLICQVSDGSITAPHLRRAAFTDEGGRGLFLVAQCTERWGTRYTAKGKIIWTEQSLPVSLPTSP